MKRSRHFTREEREIDQACTVLAEISAELETLSRRATDASVLLSELLTRRGWVLQHDGKWKPKK